MRMNLFQRLALQWDQLHPYNAGQMMRIATARTAAEIDQAWQQTLTSLGLGRTRRTGHRYQHIPSAIPMLTLREDDDLEAFISTQMNTPFDLQTEGPFRAFLLPTGHTPAIGIIYHHWVADSVSIRILLREWFYRILGMKTRQTPLPFIPSPFPLAGLRHLPRDLATLAHWRQKHQHIRRLEPEAMHDLSIGWRRISLPDDTIRHLLTAAHERDAKVSDLLLCSLAQTCHQHLPARQHWRPDMLLGEVRDVRPRLHLHDPDTFGTALALSTLACPAGLLANRDWLLQHIATQTRRLRTLPAGQHGSARLALAAGAILSRNQLLDFYRRRLPVSAGLSNLDLTPALSAFAGRDHILDYTRISPTGPVMPLAIAATTLGQQFNLSITWRRSLFTPTALNTFLHDLLQNLHSWTSTQWTELSSSVQVQGAF